MKKRQPKKDPFASGTDAARGWNSAVGLRVKVCFLGANAGSYLVEFTVGPAARMVVPRYYWPLVHGKIVATELALRPVVEATHGILTLPGLK